MLDGKGKEENIIKFLKVPFIKELLSEFIRNHMTFVVLGIKNYPIVRHPSQVNKRTTKEHEKAEASKCKLGIWSHFDITSFYNKITIVYKIDTKTWPSELQYLIPQ